MKQEMIDIVKGIMLVIGFSSLTIFVCLKIMDKKYVYFINYFQGENKYEVKITDDYQVMSEISVICKEEKCSGDSQKKIRRNVNVNKSTVKSLIEEFGLKKGTTLETNEYRVSDKQKELINEIIR